MHLVKQLVGHLAAPLVVACLLALSAVISRAAGRRRLAGWLTACAAVIAYAFALDPVGDALLGPLERRYPAFNTDHSPADITAIVVLGSGYRPGGGIPVTGALDPDGLARIVEGVRISRRLPGLPLVVSGGAPPGYVPAAIGYAQLARDLGVSTDSLKILYTPLDTADEARAVFGLLRDARFVLVTSAYHMPRAMRLMTDAGARPAPAPTGQRVHVSRGIDLSDLIPTASAARKSEQALHEYIGMIAAAAGAP